MTDTPLSTLVNALGIAAFERTANGSFQSLAPLPQWFTRLSRDGTFPFLGQILEEANRFWSAEGDGVREWGPCADVDDNGKEFHYLVKAVRVRTSTYLVLQIDEGAEQRQELLQKIRSEALAKEQKPPVSSDQ